MAPIYQQSFSRERQEWCNLLPAAILLESPPVTFTNMNIISFLCQLCWHATHKNSNTKGGFLSDLFWGISIHIWSPTPTACFLTCYPPKAELEVSSGPFFWNVRGKKSHRSGRDEEHHCSLAIPWHQIRATHKYHESHETPCTVYIFPCPFLASSQKKQGYGPSWLIIEQHHLNTVWVLRLRVIISSWTSGVQTTAPRDSAASNLQENTPT